MKRVHSQHRRRCRCNDRRLGYLGPHCVAPCKGILGSLKFSFDEGNGSENVSFKMNSRFFNLCHVYSNLLKMASVGEFPWS